jgi:hypothetical protein
VLMVGISSSTSRRPSLLPSKLALMLSLPRSLVSAFDGRVTYDQILLDDRCRAFRHQQIFQVSASSARRKKWYGTYLSFSPLFSLKVDRIYPARQAIRIDRPGSRYSAFRFLMFMCAKSSPRAQDFLHIIIKFDVVIVYQGTILPRLAVHPLAVCLADTSVSIFLMPWTTALATVCGFSNITPALGVAQFYRF